MPDIKTALEQALAKAQHATQLPTDWDDEGGEAAIESITTKAKEATMPRPARKFSTRSLRKATNRAPRPH
jgi:hypothetical protein